MNEIKNQYSIIEICKDFYSNEIREMVIFFTGAFSVLLLDIDISYVSIMAVIFMVYHISSYINNKR
jgi:hypothetical protein